MLPDINESVFRPENALEEAMLQAYESGDAQEFLSALATSDVYLPTEKSPARAHEAVAEEGDELSLPVIDGADGRQYVPVFSSLTQLARVRPQGGGYRRLRGRALAAVVPPELAVALNPGGQLGLPLAPAQVAQLASVPTATGGASAYLVGHPKEPPTALLDALRTYAESRDDVRSLYNALIVRAPGAPPEHVIGLELDPGIDPQQVVEGAAEAGRASGIDRAGFLPLQPGVDAGDVGRFMLRETEPFWRR